MGFFIDGVGGLVKACDVAFRGFSQDVRFGVGGLIVDEGFELGEPSSAAELLDEIGVVSVSAAASSVLVCSVDQTDHEPRAHLH